MQKRSSKSESTRKTKQTRSCWNFFTLVKVNSQRSTWQCDVTLGLRGRTRSVAGAWSAWGAWVSVGISAWRRMWCSLWLFFVGFYSGLAILSLYAFALAVGWAERWYLRVVGTVGVTTMTRFCQWLLDEGEGNGRTPEMSTGTRKSEEWFWYHVDNIKRERKTE